MSAFVHLRVHTEYSLRDSTVRLKPLFARARKLGLPALGLSDEATLFALVKFYRAAQAAGNGDALAIRRDLHRPSAEKSARVIGSGEPQCHVKIALCIKF